MKNDCQDEWFETERLTYDQLSDVARYSLERCIDKIRNGADGLVREEFDNGEVYSYRCNEKINFGINGKHGNIFRGQTDF
jgi:hypothetical protein